MSFRLSWNTAYKDFSYRRNDNSLFIVEMTAHCRNDKFVDYVIPTIGGILKPWNTAYKDFSYRRNDNSLFIVEMTAHCRNDKFVDYVIPTIGGILKPWNT